VNPSAFTPNQANCTFCAILAGHLPTTIVSEDAHAIAVVDLRQFHEGHVLVIPRRHVSDIRAADDATIVATMRMVARVSRAVDRCFPLDGLSIWHSAGAGANQEVPHLHIHVHPRYIGDGLLRIYPSWAEEPSRITLSAIGEKLRGALDSDPAMAT
jgi:histidine triad (HIT) family protein